MIFGLILAGGVGSRMGADKPKQYLEIGDKPIIVHTIERFIEYESFEKIIVLCPDEWIGYTRDIIKDKCENKKEADIEIITGGDSRNETIMNGIAYIEEHYGVDDDTIIVTHDAARPFINNRIISENVGKTLEYGAATTAIPAVDTILDCNNGVIENIPDRSSMYQCQTPQTFHAKQLRELYFSLTDSERGILTDASKILVLSGKKVAIVNGERTNIKITYKEDMIFAESIAKQIFAIRSAACS